VSHPDRTSSQQVLYLVTCAAPPAMDVQVLIDLAQQDGWEVCLIATPRAFQWLDVPGLAERTSHPVRHDYKLPGEPDVLPEPDAIVVAPATFNTLNKWAAGIADTLALGLLCEATGRGLPVVVLPYLNAAQAEHPALAESIGRLRHLGVRVLFGPDVLPLHRPRQGKRDQYPWHLILPAIKEAAPAGPPERQDFRNSLP
jgi:Flavoprotein